MVLGKLPVPGASYNLDYSRARAYALTVGAGGGCLDIFTLIYPFFPLSPSLWETARYRLKYCLKGPINPKPSNQPNSYYVFYILTLTNSTTEIIDCIGCAINYMLYSTLSSSFLKQTKNGIS